jgi:hypothetical protein
MRFTNVRRAATLITALAMTALVVTPARADAGTSCYRLLESTPTVTADLDGDGYPEYSVPAIEDVDLCVQGDVELYDSPQLIERTDCAEWLTCVAFRVTVSFGASADVGMELCFTFGRARPCTGWDPGPVPVTVGPQTICVGYDLGGGHPCSGSVFALE